MNKVDRFFKKKVEDLIVEPRSEAWAKLEANLSKKNKGLIWFKAAAALLLMGLFIASILWLQQGKENQHMAEQVKTTKPAIVPVEKKMKEGTKNRSRVPELKNKNISEIRKSNTKKQIAIEHPTVPTSVKKELTDVSFKEIEKEKETISSQTIAAISVEEKPIVIEYTLESIHSQKNESPIVAETTEKKNSLQKALDFAREAKNSDSPLGGLRQAKDDLFALNFIKDKQKKQ